MLFSKSWLRCARLHEADLQQSSLAHPLSKHITSSIPLNCFFVCVCLSICQCVHLSDLFFWRRVEACLPHCQQNEVNDAQAYLLERLGDIAAAMKLYVQHIQRCNAALVHAVLQGDVQLPNVNTACGRCAHTCQCAMPSPQTYCCLTSLYWFGTVTKSIDTSLPASFKPSH